MGGQTVGSKQQEWLGEEENKNCAWIMWKNKTKQNKHVFKQ